MLNKNNLYRGLFIVSTIFIIIKIVIISAIEYNFQLYQLLNIVMLGIVAMWSYGKFSDRLIISDYLFNWSLIIFGLIYIFRDIFSLFPWK
jgi:hypothetical protein